MRKKFYALFFSIILSLPIGVLAADEVYVGGESIGIEVEYEGVMITGTYAIMMQGQTYDPSTNNLQIGDIIQSVNQVKTADMKELYTQLSKYTDVVNEIPIQINRDGMTIDILLKTTYDKDKQSFQSGLYVKDSITGVGTMTFYNPANKTYGALGHEVMDSDLKEIAQVHDGTIYPATVNSITKAQSDIAGEKHATILYDDPIGSIEKNTNIGIYGYYDRIENEQMLLPWASRDEVHTGSAKVYTVLTGTQIQSFDIEITKLHKQDASNVKGIEFQVTDPNLLAQTNGIIQGMSGSPIVQDGKLIGAITHVITANPATGYGVYIEWMLEEANTLQK